MVRRKKTHRYCTLFWQYNQKRKKGVRIDVYSKPKGKKTELKKKYRIARGKYLLMLIGFAMFNGFARFLRPKLQFLLQAE